MGLMPKGPKGKKRPVDVIGNAVKVTRIATGKLMGMEDVASLIDALAVPKLRGPYEKKPLQISN